MDPSKIEEILGVSSRSLNNTPSEEGNVETKGKNVLIALNSFCQKSF